MAVAPLAGAWIEMHRCGRECLCLLVAPLAGAWIEIDCRHATRRATLRRSPRGSVD